MILSIATVSDGILSPEMVFHGPGQDMSSHPVEIQTYDAAGREFESHCSLIGC
jgi:hypothetical protein